MLFVYFYKMHVLPFFRLLLLTFLLILPGSAQIDMQAHGTATQSSNWDAQNSFPASFGLDGNTGNFTHTDNLPNSWWQVVLDQAFMIERVEVVNRANCCPERLGGLTLRVFDGSDQVVHEEVMTNPGDGGSFNVIFTNLTEVKRVWIGLENGDANGGNNDIVAIAELRLHEEFIPPPSPTGPNWALNQPSYMVRLSDGLPPPANANDGDYNTSTATTTATVDGYWEVDLGASIAIDHVRAYAAACCIDKVANATMRFFDEDHNSIYSEPVPNGIVGQYDMILSRPICARYVRIGLEDKTRTAGGWQVGFKEVEVYGRLPDEVGLLHFDASATNVTSGQAVTLAWEIERIDDVSIYPGVGLIDGLTDTNGMGTITVNPLVSTEYLMVARDGCGLNTTSVFVAVTGAYLSVRINEFVADNRLSHEDGNGDASDWIELYNPNDFTVDLTGFGLSDRSDQPMKWVFPSASIPAFDTLIVYASGSNNPIDPVAGFHASWKLASSGESIQLTAPDGMTVIDQLLNYPAQMEDLAFGRDLSGQLRFLEPTPGTVNFTGSYAGWLSPLNISHPRGFYTNALSVTLTHANTNTNVQVFVSLAGDVPDMLYTGAIAVSGTSVIRADVRRPDYKSPRTLSHSYFYVEDTIASAVMSTAITQDAQYMVPIRKGMTNLPVFSVSIPDDPSRSEQGASVEIIWPETGAHQQSDCGFAIYGGAYTTFPKRNFRLSFRKDYGTPKLNAPLFVGHERGFPDDGVFDTLDLRAGSHDMMDRGFYMSNRFADDSMLDMGSLNPHGRFVHLYLNGVYWGQYHLRERMVDQFLADHLGGKQSDYLTIRGNDNIGSTFVPGTPDPVYRSSWDRIRANGGNYAFVKDYLDVNSLIDFMMIWFSGDCESEYRGASTVEAGSGAKFWMADADGLLRVPNDRTSNAGPGGLFGALNTEADSDYTTLRADRIFRHLFHGGALTPEASLKRLDDRMTEIQYSLIAECARWGNRTPANWNSAADNIRNTMFPSGASTLFTRLKNSGLYPNVDPPVFAQRGGLVAAGYQPGLSAPSGTIYYTLDGSDPRMSGGTVSPMASVFTTGDILVTSDTVVRTRVLSAGTWSAVDESTFYISDRIPASATHLAITEIHFNPDGPDEYECIELMNIGTNRIDLGGVSLSNAVTFTFPPFFGLEVGELAVVVENTTAFDVRYRQASSPWYFPGIRVAGQWSGSLDNAGERIVLLASNQTEIASIRYDSLGFWPERADGDGSSLELRDLSLAAVSGEASSWRSSCLYHGSPGRLVDCSKQVVINEVLSHTDLDTDWIEFLNVSTGTVDISGWYISDQINLPLRYQIPSRPPLAPGAYVSFSAGELGFGFSELGSDAVLSTAVGTNVVSFVDTVDFPAADREYPFGRTTRSDAVVDFTELRAPTRDSANALPRMGPLVISEIMYHPADARAEYVELVNITAHPVALYDAAFPSNTWALSGAVAFDFPMNVVIPACGSVLVCGTNVTSFRSSYGLSLQQAVLGPWTGSLDNVGETLRLRRPGTPELDGFVPRIRVDHVTYLPTAPWPGVAHGGGPSLERMPLLGYGNDPNHWGVSVNGGTPGVAGSYCPSALPVRISASATLTTLSIPSLRLENYLIEYTDSLFPPDWQLLMQVSGGVEGVLNVMDAAGGMRRYYRARWAE
ncbi:MAG: hypothetical protein ACI97B_002074 [Verrucomicrobiales bacterium]|jgi:hypothetical protein